MKKINEMLGMEMRLLLVFQSQTDRQTERTNQELEQYLRMFIDHRQDTYPEWPATAVYYQ